MVSMASGELGRQYEGFFFITTALGILGIVRREAGP